MPRITVYVCREPHHEKLIDMVRDVIERVKGKKPKLSVVRLKLESADDFPLYLRQLEEMFGGIATADFRKYKIESLPAVVLNDQLALQGKVPTMEELEEALAYAGLKFARRESRAEAVLVPQPRPLERKPVSEPTVQGALLQPAGYAQLREREPPPPVRVPILEKLSAAEAREATGQKVEARGAATAREESRVAPAQPQPAAEPVQRPREPVARTIAPSTQAIHHRPAPAAVQKPPLVQEEFLIVAPPAKPARAAGARESCSGCVFYDEGAGKCLRYRIRVADPSRPPCATR